MSDRDKKGAAKTGIAILSGSEEQIDRELPSILGNIYDGVYITDGNAVTLLINQAYQAISGLKPEDVLGMKMKDVVSNGLIDKSGTLAVLETGKSVTMEQTFRTGKKALITSTPHYDGSGNISMVITVVRDITELYDLQKAYQESEERHRSERDFLRRSRRFASQMVVADPDTQTVVERALKVAPLNATVLLLGETGVGKEEFAHLIYENSSRADQSFIGVNCGAIPPALIESELFGYERGAFTGASREGKKGVFESADKGTVFLDEIGELPLNMQVHLLRILQNMEITRVGGVRSIPVDVRIIAATNRDLQQMVQEKTFREDLYYRLNVVPITVPPLRERKQDIAPLVLSFLRELNKKYRDQKYFTHAAMEALNSYSWPGNVRELKNVVEQAVILSPQNEIYPVDLPIYSKLESREAERADSVEGGEDLKTELARVEYGHICRAYAKHGSVRAAAASLGMNDSTFVRKRQKYKRMFEPG